MMRCHSLRGIYKSLKVMTIASTQKARCAPIMARPRFFVSTQPFMWMAARKMTQYTKRMITKSPSGSSGFNGYGFPLMRDCMNL
jgi:hypothetical protein